MTQRLLTAAINCFRTAPSCSIWPPAVQHRLGCNGYVPKIQWNALAVALRPARKLPKMPGNDERKGLRLQCPPTTTFNCRGDVMPATPVLHVSLRYRLQIALQMKEKQPLTN
jgi:hypothetical protein